MQTWVYYIRLVLVIPVFSLFILLAQPIVPTPTIPLPQAHVVSLTPSPLVPDVEYLGTPVSTLNGSLPIAITTTPTPSNTPDPQQATATSTSSNSSMSDESQRLLDTANNNFGAAGSMQVDGSGEILVKQGTAEGRVGLLIEGKIENINDPRKLKLASSLTLSQDIEGQQSEVVVEERIVDDVFYGRGVQQSTCRSTRWIATPFESILANVLQSTGGVLPFDLMMGAEATPEALSTEEASSIQAFLALMDFGRFAVTTREDTSGDEARFRTVVDVRGFISAPDKFVPLIVLVAKYGGIDLGSNNASAFAFIIQPLILSYAPKLQLEIITTVDPQKQVIKKLEINVNATLSPKIFGLSSNEMVELQLNLVLVFSHYGESFVVETPTDAYFVKSIDDFNSISKEEVLIEGCS